MDFGQIGLGSNNMLNSNLISKMKESEEAMQIGIFQRRLDVENIKLEKLDTIKEAVNTLKSTVMELGNSTNYNIANISGNNTINLKVTDSSLAKDFTLNVKEKAHKGIIQTNTISDVNDTISEDETLVFSIGNGGDREIKFAAGSSYQDIIDRLNLEQGVDAKLIKVNENEYRISLATEKTGLENEIKIKSETDGLKNSLGFSIEDNYVQKSTNAVFDYNGITIERSNNLIKDIVPGVEFNINNIGENNISIKPDGQALAASISTFVDTYNDMVKNIKDALKSDNYQESFVGDREIKEILTNIDQSIFSSSFEGNDTIKNLADLGIEINKEGILTINDSFVDGDSKNLLELSDKYFMEIKNLFSNVSDNKNNNGIFVKTFDVIDNMINDNNNGSLNSLEERLHNSTENIKKQMEKTQAKIDKQYELLTQKFQAFDALISQANSAFSSLDMQIKQSMVNQS